MLLSLLGCGEPVEEAGTWPAYPETDRVEVPAATYLQGKGDAEPGPYGDEWKENEQPQHSVSVTAFSMDRTEVTEAQWAEFLNSIADAAQVFHHPLQPLEWDGEGFRPLEGEVPVAYVSWYEAAAYCAWAGGRLPTEAEWELAAKGSESDDRYPWGADGASCELAVYFTNSTLCEPEPQPVGSRSPAGDSPAGLADMAGNVAEWVFDRYGDYGVEDLVDPAGPTEGDYRVMRGGGFRDVDDSIRTTARWAVLPEKRSEGVGFRCAYEEGS
ncbi:MAG TPA: SUMF1/EgtB/PvdO family nonheme iron enzyme [Myxococcota bacterium]|nr:SUMF1/EgtB/PvdO family nonheme iron enzyme [Myxococcota bacterium]